MYVKSTYDNMLVVSFLNVLFLLSSSCAIVFVLVRMKLTETKMLQFFNSGKNTRNAVYRDNALIYNPQISHQYVLTS